MTKICANIGQKLQFGGRFGTHCEGFEIGPLQNTYMPETLFLTCWNLCVFCGGHGRFLRILGVPKNAQTHSFFGSFFGTPFFRFSGKKAPQNCPETGSLFQTVDLAQV